MLLQIIFLVSLSLQVEQETSQIYLYNNFSLIGVDYSETLDIDFSLLSYFENYDLTDDPEYLNQKEYYDELSYRYSDIFDKGFEKYRDYFYLKQNNGTVGLYTKYKIKEQTVIGSLGGIVSFKPQFDTVFWPYASEMNTNQDLYIEFGQRANFLNFFNFSKNYNCDDIIFPHQNKWHILFVTNRDIQPNEQIILAQSNEQYSEEEIQELQQYFQPNYTKYQEKHVDFFNGQVQQIQSQHFEQMGLVYLNQSRIDFDIYFLIRDHDVEQDKFYKENEQNIKEFIQINQNIMENAPDLDKILYVKYINENIGYGCFAKQNIKKNQVLSEYTGVITQVKGNTDYSWQYKSNFDEYKVQLFTTAYKEGNLLRFINDYEVHNVKAVYIPYKNKWNVYYKAIKEIQIGEELSVSYGSKYWTQRNRSEPILEEIQENKEILLTSSNQNLYKIDKLKGLDIITNKDFQNIGLKYLKEIQIYDLKIKQLVTQNNVFQDEEYLEYKIDNDKAIQLYSQQIENLPNMDEIIEARYISQEIGYGVFAKKDIYQNEIIGQYTGILQLASKDASYSWKYCSKFKQLQKELVIDGIKEGNLLRFVNDYETHNIEILMLPHQNIWKIYYIANTQIMEGEELSVSYGDIYWRKRIQLDNENQQKKDIEYNEL